MSHDNHYKTSTGTPQSHKSGPILMPKAASHSAHAAHGMKAASHTSHTPHGTKVTLHTSHVAARK